MTTQNQLDYWRRRLSGLMAAVTLPSDRDRPPLPSFLRETVSRALSAELEDRLRSLASQWNTSPFVVLLAGLNALLHRYTAAVDIPIGTVLDGACGSGGASLVVLRTSVSGDQTVEDLVRQLSAAVQEAATHGQCPLSDIRDAVAPDRGDPSAPLFHIAFEYVGRVKPPAGHDALRHHGPGFEDELAQCDVIVRVREETGQASSWAIEYDTELFNPATIERLLDHLETVLAGIVTEPAHRVGTLPWLTPAEREQLLVTWNQTQAEAPVEGCIHQAFEAQVARTPGAVAAVFKHQRLTYRQLNARANQLAHRLRKLGVGPDSLVGICVDRSIEMLIGLLGILKAGGAYLPLDPAYPRERLAFMLKDADVRVLLTQQHLLGDLPHSSAAVFCLDSVPLGFPDEPEENPDHPATGTNLAYVIYTSGSTGRPKGVMVCHRNVLNFFSGMDRAIGGDGPGVWLAITSISFDISVLELFWTLARGFTVVIYPDEFRRPDRVVPSAPRSEKKIDFSLLYFASEAGQEGGNRYRLLLEGAKFADEHDFDAVWTPERHFHAFGGLYPNPSVTSAAVAAVTKRIHIRAGSVVLPLQNPIRVAEEWSVVDNLSGGRAALSFASGWQINDFVLAPQHYAERKEIMLREIETVRRLWRGETLTLPGVDGKPVPVKIWPPPIQSELPIWITATGNPETCRAAGQLGANLLTHLIGQKLDDLAEKIRLYRNARREHGHPGEGRVTLMLHTFVGEDLEAVRATVREPFSNYLRSSVDLLKHSPWGFAPARLTSNARVKKLSTAPTELTEDELSELLAHAFDGYFENSSLFGTPEVCLRMVERLRGIGVDEIACLIDFGVEAQVVLDSLRWLDEVRVRSNESAAGAAVDFSLAAVARRHGVTHFQCTPSMAGLLAAQPENREWLSQLRRLMIGGEAFPAALARQLRHWVRGSIHNMYGPTETTVWSTTQTVGEVDGAVSIGRPIANTQIFLLDENRQPVPVGVAGELCIGGAGVVRGYLHRPELTAEKFIANPFDGDPHSRLYRTGDVARYRDNGSIEFLGRMDHQVKIRGHRIELTEIESVLGQHESVRQCVVMAREEAPGDQRVVAYVVPRPGAPREPKVLRDFLGASLPDFMVPGGFVFLERFPQTPNGKIDRRALPAPKELPAPGASPFVAPRTPVEQGLAQIWEELLGTDRVGAEDNFFELGGHSLLAMQLVGQVRKRFRVDLPLKNLFERPTIAGLAEAIDALSWSARSRAPAVPVGDREEVEL